MASPSIWQEIRLGDVVQVVHGWPFKSEYFCEWSSDLPIVVGIGNFQYTGGFRFDTTQVKGYQGDYPKEYELSPGDIMLVMTCQTAGGEILGIPGRIPDNGITYLHNQRMGKVLATRPDLVDPDYLYQIFLWKDFNQELVASSSGTKIVHTAPKRIEAFRFTCPPLHEQRAIARILGSLDDKIELNRHMNRTLEAMAQALFKSWFVDFDPVIAKREGRRPFGMDDATASLFSEHFQETAMGPIPSGWRFVAIGELVRVVGGSTPRTDEPSFWEGGEIFWATPRDLASLPDPILTKTERRITHAGLSQISSGLLPSGTVLLSSRAPIGYVAIAEIPVAINQGFIALVCNETLPNYYVLQWLKENMDTIESRANGTTFLEISKANFRPIPVIVPTKSVMERFVETTSKLHRRLVCTVGQIQHLSALRDTLLPKLLSGEIRVRQAEKIVSEVT